VVQSLPLHRLPGHRRRSARRARRSARRPGMMSPTSTRLLRRCAPRNDIPLSSLRAQRRSRWAAQMSTFTTDKPSGRVLGRSVPRLEDRPLVTGRGRFVGDISFPHELHMRVVRSPYAHAVLRAVDIAAAQAAPGVVAVWTVADIADLPPIDFRDPAGEGL